MRILLVFGLTAFLIASPSLSAQPYGTDLLASTTGSILLRIGPTGAVKTVTTWKGGLNMVAMANNNRDVIVAQRTSAPSILVVDTNLNQVVKTLWSGPPIAEPDYLNPTHTGDYLVASNTDLFLLKPDGSSITTVRSGSPFQNLQGVIQDVATGHYAAGDLSVHAIFMVAGDGVVVTTYSLASMNPFSITQDHRDGALIVGNGGGRRVHRVDTGIGTIKTIFSASGNFNAICFDRWSGNGEIVSGTTVIYRFDIHGTVVTTHRNIPSINSGLCFDKGRNVVPVKIGSPNHYSIDLNFPGYTGKSYALGLSITGFTPGIPIGGRVIQLVPDDVLGLSLKGALFPLLKNNIGVLDTFDRATVTLDLRIFRELLRGLRIWAVAVVLDPQAPNSIGVISKPRVIVME